MNLHYSIDILILSLNDFKKKQVYNVCLFLSRIFKAVTIEDMDVQHIRGVILYGPPGTGKTLIARKLSNILNSVPPKIVNGPELLDKYVGESEKHVRELFDDAKSDFDLYKNKSPLHVIIIDEIDSLCKKRGGQGDGTGVGDKIVNQFLSLIDGVNSLNNILIIGMTNRLDLLDKALLRPGRFEVVLEIGLPDEFGRMEIFKIHTDHLFKKEYMSNIDLTKIVEKTQNFTGAEIAGLVRSAVSYGLERGVDSSGNGKKEMVKLSQSDFDNGLNEIIPLFGTSKMPKLPNNFINFAVKNEDMNVEEWYKLTYDKIKILMERCNNTIVCFSAIPQGGKTTCLIKFCSMFGIKFTKYISNWEYIGLSDQNKSIKIKDVFTESSRVDRSCIIIDNIEDILGYSYIDGVSRFSSLMLTTIKTLLTTTFGNERCIFISTQNFDVMRRLDIDNLMTSNYEIPQPKDKSVFSVINHGKKIE